MPRSALREALLRLEREGRVRRKIGRGGGIFAADGKIERHLNTSQSVPEMLRQQGFTTTTRLVAAHVSTASPGASRALRLVASPGEEPRVFTIVRIRHADGVPWSHETAVVPAQRFPGLLRQPLDGSLYQLFDRVYGLRPESADETIDVVAATPEHALSLGVPAGAPLLLVRRTAYAVGGVPVEFAHDLFRADRTTIHARRLGFVTPSKSTRGEPPRSTP